MKLTLNNPSLIGGGIGNPGKGNILSCTLAGDFTPSLAKTLNCYDDTYNKHGDLRSFSYHGLRLEIPEAHVRFVIGAEATKEWPCKVTHLEVEQDGGSSAKLRLKIAFSQTAKMEAFATLFDPGEALGIKEIIVEGDQSELDFGKGKDEDE